MAGRTARLYAKPAFGAYENRITQIHNVRLRDQGRPRRPSSKGGSNLDDSTDV
jgi:hypothetical protein